jgi:DNA polymerase III alpha subunit
MDKENNTIYKGMASIKYLNENVAESLYELKDNEYKTFTDLLVDLKSIKMNSRQLDILIRLNFFEEFGKRQKLLDIVEIFNLTYGKRQFKKDKLPCREEFIRQFATTETEKIFKGVDTIGLMRLIESTISNDDMEVKEIVKAELEYMGAVNYMNDTLDPMTIIILSVDTKYTPKMVAYSPLTGNTETVKISKKEFENQPLEVGDMIIIFDIYEKQKKTKDKETGKWITLEDSELWIDGYKIVEN